MKESKAEEVPQEWYIQYASKVPSANDSPQGGGLRVRNVARIVRVCERSASTSVRLRDDKRRKGKRTSLSRR